MPRYIITADTVLETDVYHVVDTAFQNHSAVSGHITATCFNHSDAEMVAAKLNGRATRPTHAGAHWPPWNSQTSA